MYTFLTLILLILFPIHSSRYQSIEDMSISQISIVSFHLTFLTLHLLPYSKLSWQNLSLAKSLQEIFLFYVIFSWLFDEYFLPTLKFIFTALLSQSLKIEVSVWILMSRCWNFFYFLRVYYFYKIFLQSYLASIKYLLRLVRFKSHNLCLNWRFLIKEVNFLEHYWKDHKESMCFNFIDFIFILFKDFTNFTLGIFILLAFLQLIPLKSDSVKFFTKIAI